MKALIKKVWQLAKWERAQQEPVKGKYINSAHEGYALMLEELEEAEHAFVCAKENLLEFLGNVRTDASNERLDEVAKHIEKWSLEGAAELIQLAGLAQKVREREE